MITLMYYFVRRLVQGGCGQAQLRQQYVWQYTAACIHVCYILLYVQSQWTEQCHISIAHPLKAIG